jgi:hypothetical protein
MRNPFKNTRVGKQLRPSKEIDAAIESGFCFLFGELLASMWNIGGNSRVVSLLMVIRRAFALASRARWVSQWRLA